MLKNKKILISSLMLSTIAPATSFAHGALSYPESRQMYCMGSQWNGGNDPVCKAIADQGKQNVWTDWSSEAQGDANGRVADPSKESYLINKHTAAISSKGGVCDGGNSSFSILNDTSIDWDKHATKINIQDQKSFSYQVSAPHKTNFNVGGGLGYLDLYITNNNWKPGSKVTKDDLVHLCTYQPDSSGVSPMQTGTGGHTENFKCEIPDTVSNGDHVIFSIWQRSDSAEAFYSCSDVDIINATPAEITWDKSTEMLSYVVKPNDTIEFSANEGDRTIAKSVVITDKNQNDWQYELAQKINSSSDAIQAGLLNKATNKVEPQHNNFNNALYISSAAASVSNISFKHIEAAQPEPEHNEYKAINRDGTASNSIQDIKSLKAGDKVVFRLFNNKVNLLTNTASGSTDIDKISLKITDANLSKWKFALAKKFNKNANENGKIVIGVLNNNEVTPVNNASANNAVYILDSKKESGDNYSWTIDIRNIQPEPGPQPEPTPSDVIKYPDQIGTYKAGTVVTDGTYNYTCKYINWCNDKTYSPTGPNSLSAWDNDKPTEESGSWNSSKTYYAGDIVEIDGVKYRADWENTGSNPKESGEWGVWKVIK